MSKLTVLMASSLLFITCLVGCSTQESATKTTTNNNKITFKPIELTLNDTVSQSDESLKLITEIPAISEQETAQSSSIAHASFLRILADLPLATSFESTEIDVWPQSPTFLKHVEAALGNNSEDEVLSNLMETLRLASEHTEGLPINLRLAPYQPIIGTATAGTITRYPTVDNTLVR